MGLGQKKSTSSKIEIKLHSENPKQIEKNNDNRDSDDLLRNLPEWLEEFTDNLEDSEILVPAHISQDSDTERPTKVVIKIKEAQYLYPLLKRPKLRRMQENQDYESSLQKANWKFSSSSREVW